METTAKISRHWAIIVIVLIAATLRLWQLGSAELMFDEGLYAFRSIGYLDYLESPDQVTPIQLLADEKLPFWTGLSFHDHPPLFFLIQHIFFSLLGTSLFVARLPSALAGIGSVALVYFIIRRFGNTKPALLGAAVAGATFAHVALSRLAMMESTLVFFILLNIYFFFRFLENPKRWLAFGVTLGLCFLTKYTGFFLLPTYAVFLLIKKSPILRDKRLYFALLTTVALFSPVIIYNINYYLAFGHFDLQFASLFKQATPEWQGVGGKQMDPFSDIAVNLLTIYSIPFLALFAAGAVLKPRLLPMLGFVFLTLMLAVIGSAIRFVSLYLVPGIFFIVLFYVFLSGRLKNKQSVLILAGIFLIYELTFSISNIFLNTADYGIVRLDNYFDSAFGNYRLAGLPRHPNPHLNEVIQKYASSKPVGLDLIGIVYDDSIATPARLWLFSRRQYYQGIPTIPASGFMELIRNQKISDLSGFEIYFVKAGPATTVRPVSVSYAETIEANFKNIGLSPEVVISDRENAPAFTVYKVKL
ncbi:MAG: glycosyltransferase family 39 protein [Candidatus Harrisonbacteria bacterium]|nr:glycosyltransferase family 39 protein [Candidatus Harrisonbacteria bacterium]